jgi:hypothetical protein
MRMLHSNERRTEKSGDDRNAFLQRKRRLRDDKEWNKMFRKFRIIDIDTDRLCGLAVRVSGSRSRGPGFDSRPYQIFWQVRGLERGPLSLVITTEELIEKRSSGSGLENRD